MNIFSAVGAIVMSVIQALIEVPIIWVGESVLFLITFGRHKPRWDFYNSGGGDFAFLSEMSFWIGAIAICGVGATIKAMFFDPPL